MEEISTTAWLEKAYQPPLTLVELAVVRREVEGMPTTIPLRLAWAAMQATTLTMIKRQMERGRRFSDEDMIFLSIRTIAMLDYVTQLLMERLTDETGMTAADAMNSLIEGDWEWFTS